MKLRKHIAYLFLATFLLAGVLLATNRLSVEASDQTADKVVVSVEGLTLGQGFYLEPKIVTFDEFIQYWQKKGSTVTPEQITAGGVLSYALKNNNTPMDYAESPQGPGYLSRIKYIDQGKPAAQLPEFLSEGGVVLDGGKDDPDYLSEHDYTGASGWMFTEGNIMSNQALAGHYFYSYGKSYTQDGDNYYVVRLQFSVAGLGADLGFTWMGSEQPYSYEAADKSQLYILYARLSESEFFRNNPQAQKNALAVMEKLNATQEEVDQAYAALNEASSPRTPSITTDLSEEEVFYSVNAENVVPLQIEATGISSHMKYEWYSSKDKENWTSLGEAGKDNRSYTPAVDHSGTTYYKCVVSDFDETVNRPVFVESKIARITAGASSPEFTKNLDATEWKGFVNAQPPALEVSARSSDGGTLSYQWFYSTDENQWTAISGAAEPSYTPEITSIGSFFYKCQVTNTKNGLSSISDSRIKKMTIYVDTPHFVTNLTNETLTGRKNGVPVTLEATAEANDDGVITYQWYSGSTPNFSNMHPIEGAVESTYNVPSENTSSLYYRVEAINTVQGHQEKCVSEWTRVIVRGPLQKPIFTVNLPAEKTYYVNGSSQSPLSVDASAGSDAVTYQWYKSDKETTSVENMELIPRMYSSRYMPSTNQPGTTWYACRAISRDGDTMLYTDSNVVKVTVIETNSSSGSSSDTSLSAPSAPATDKKQLQTGSIWNDAKTSAVYRVKSSNQIEYVRPLTKKKSVVIPSSITQNGTTYKVTSISAKAFKKDKKLKKIVIPSTVTSIGKQAFYGCKSLKNVTIKTTKLTSKSIGSKAFKGLNRKATIKVPAKKYKLYKSVLKKKGVSTQTRIKK